jgi:hypothetical protein
MNDAMAAVKKSGAYDYLGKFALTRDAAFLSKAKEILK